MIALVRELNSNPRATSLNLLTKPLGPLSKGVEDKLYTSSYTQAALPIHVEFYRQITTGYGLSFLTISQHRYMYISDEVTHNTLAACCERSEGLKYRHQLNKTMWLIMCY